MTIGELFEKLKGVPLSADVRVYDTKSNEYPDFTINTTDQFDYESQMPIVIIQIESEFANYVDEHRNCNRQ